MEFKGISYLRKKLNSLSTRTAMRYEYYAMKTYEPPSGITIPPEIRKQYRAVLGWCAKSVDCLADRMVFRGFENDEFNVMEIFNINNPDVFFDNIVLSTLIGACSFVYLSKDEENQVRLQVIEATNATGIVDPITGLLTEGYAVLSRDEHGRPKQEAYFTGNETIIIENGNVVMNNENTIGIPLLVPVIHRPDAVRPFGRSRISRASIYFQRFAQRTLERADVTAEFYSYPQKYVLGLDPDAEPLDKWQATISSMLQFSSDDKGNKPTVGQFTTSSMSPFTEQLRTAAAGFAGESGLTPEDLGFTSDNPSSVEAIKASHENLRSYGRKSQRSMGSGLLNVAYVAACLRDDFKFNRSQFYRTKPKWEPLFEADATTLSLIGDGAIKINNAIPGFIDGETIRDLTGIQGKSNTPKALNEVIGNG